MGDYVDIKINFPVRMSPAFEAMVKRLQPIMAAMQPLHDLAHRCAEDERVALEINKQGLVPHSLLWPYFEQSETNDEYAVGGPDTASRLWTKLHPDLRLKDNILLNDHRLSKMYQQMLEAHQFELYEAVRSLAVSTMERAVRLTRRRPEPPKTEDWLDTEIGKLPLEALGGRRGVRVWQTILDSVFVSVGKDTAADEDHVLRRHAVAHGWGSKVADEVVSLNAILLAHFILSSAAAIQAFREVP